MGKKKKKPETLSREETIRLLQSGTDGVQEWNCYRDEGGEVPGLSMANFKWANLCGVDLSNANLSGSELVGTNLAESYLLGANLSGACLMQSNLYGAFLADADLSESVMYFTALSQTNLSRCKGLESVVHLGASDVGVTTLLRSRGNIPEAFLRGCGVPETVILFQKSLVGKKVDFFSCFISYSHADKSFARRLHDQLQAKGIRCWLDEHAMVPGEDIYKEVDRGIRHWDKVLLCASKDSLNSWWVGREVDTAIEKERQLHRQGKDTLAIIPLDLDGTMLARKKIDKEYKWISPHAAALRKRLAADFTGWESDDAKFEASLDLVVKALRSDGGAKVAPPEPKL